MEERLSVQELNHLYERDPPEEPDELVQGLFIVAPRGGRGVTLEVLEAPSRH